MRSSVRSVWRICAVVVTVLGARDGARADLTTGVASSNWFISTSNPNNQTQGSNLTPSGGGSTGGGVLRTTVGVAAVPPGSDPEGAFVQLTVLADYFFTCQGANATCASRQAFTVTDPAFFALDGVHGSLPQTSSTTTRFTDAGGNTPAGVLLPGTVYTLEVSANVNFFAQFPVFFRFNEGGFVNLYPQPVPAPGATAIVILGGAIAGARRQRRSR